MSPTCFKKYLSNLEIGEVNKTFIQQQTHIVDIQCSNVQNEQPIDIFIDFQRDGEEKFNEIQINLNLVVEQKEQFNQLQNDGEDTEEILLLCNCEKIDIFNVNVDFETKVYFKIQNNQIDENKIIQYRPYFQHSSFYLQNINHIEMKNITFKDIENIDIEGTNKLFWDDLQFVDCYKQSELSILKENESLIKITPNLNSLDKEKKDLIYQLHNIEFKNITCIMGITIDYLYNLSLNDIKFDSNQAETTFIYIQNSIINNFSNIYFTNNSVENQKMSAFSSKVSAGSFMVFYKCSIDSQIQDILIENNSLGIFLSEYDLQFINFLHFYNCFIYSDMKNLRVLNNLVSTQDLDYQYMQISDITISIFQFHECDLVLNIQDGTYNENIVLFPDIIDSQFLTWYYKIQLVIFNFEDSKLMENLNFNQNFFSQNIGMQGLAFQKNIRYNNDKIEININQNQFVNNSGICPRNILFLNTQCQGIVKIENNQFQNNILVLRDYPVPNGNNIAIQETYSLYNQYQNSKISISYNNFTNNYGNRGTCIKLINVQYQDNQIDHNLFYLNDASQYGGSIYYENTIQNTKPLSIIQNKFKQNFASLGAAIFISYGTIVVINDNTFQGQFAQNLGGAIYIKDLSVNLQVQRNFFQHNYAQEGGAIYVNSVNSGNIKNNTFSINLASQLGGALLFENQLVQYDLKIHENIFKHNQAILGGGVLCIKGWFWGNNVGNIKILDIKSNLFQENQSTQSGGQQFESDLILHNYIEGNNSTITYTQPIVFNCTNGEYYDEQSFTCKMCLSGYYNYNIQNNFIYCEKCPPNANCEGSYEGLYVNEGQWVDQQYKSIIKCEYNQKACRGGQYFEDQCLQGYEGFICHFCVFILPFILFKSLDLITCDLVNDKRYVSYDYSIACDSDQYYSQNLLVAIISAVVWGFIFPLFFVYKLQIKKKNNDKIKQKLLKIQQQNKQQNLSYAYPVPYYLKISKEYFFGFLAFNNCEIRGNFDNNKIIKNEIIMKELIIYMQYYTIIFFSEITLTGQISENYIFNNVIDFTDVIGIEGFNIKNYQNFYNLVSFSYPEFFEGKINNNHFHNNAIAINPEQEIQFEEFFQSQNLSILFLYNQQIIKQFDISSNVFMQNYWLSAIVIKRFTIRQVLIKEELAFLNIYENLVQDNDGLSLGSIIILDYNFDGQLNIYLNEIFQNDYSLYNQEILFANSIAIEGNINQENQEKIHIYQNLIKRNYGNIGTGIKIINIKIRYLIIEQNEITLNKAYEYGGALFISNIQDLIYGVIIRQNIIFDNKANIGGGLYIEKVENFYFYNNFLENNQGTVWGGAVFSQNIKFQQYFQNSFDTNMSKEGGALFFTGYETEDIVLEQNYFELNSAYYNGGAILFENVMVRSQISIIKNEFQLSHADNGGAMVVRGWSWGDNTMDSKNFEIKNNYFEKNLAFSSAGIIYFIKSTKHQSALLSEIIIIQDNYFYQNYGGSGTIVKFGNIIITDDLKQKLQQKITSLNVFKENGGKTDKLRPVLFNCTEGEYYSKVKLACLSCKNGSYNYNITENFYSCLQCPKNTICEGGYDGLRILKNTWINKEMTQVFPCEKNPEACIGGSNYDEQCLQGYQGPLCQILYKLPNSLQDYISQLTSIIDGYTSTEMCILPQIVENNYLLSELIWKYIWSILVFSFVIFLAKLLKLGFMKDIPFSCYLNQFLVLAMPSFVEKTIKLVLCENVGEQSYVMEDYSIECQSDQYFYQNVIFGAYKVELNLGQNMDGYLDNLNINIGTFIDKLQ
ncbi:Pectin lyase fold/virulence factor [Pseudocohnilembus persalinus]|uniref:Pectin lyase fold/virulence factor n=1 Tax=Pseudocohnilembus persalinus TaxID=266149 RepID=A0A0V0QLE8_PSEPJ|nr:Pectin lyase fold/virulence factor [Pseudocohnilembus persalinus]|eukprot:KRX02816.1 Pectin lyase fold/virulence factor [Pseudocohnilembus persalinus]